MNMESLNFKTTEQELRSYHYSKETSDLAIEDYPELKSSIQSTFAHGIEEVVIAPYSLLSMGLNVLPEDSLTLSAICDVDGIYPSDRPRQYFNSGWLHIFFTAMNWDDEVDEETDLNYTTLTKMVLLTKYTPGYHRGGSMTIRKM